MDKKICNVQQLCYAKRAVLTEGKEAGMKVIFVGNGVLNFIVQESCALDIYAFAHKGTNLSFISKNGLDNVSPDFLRRFPGGMLYTCGLDSIGAVEGHELHGLLHKTPAEVMECRADERGVKIVGKIRCSELFGRDLIITRTIETAVGSGKISITDEIFNGAYRDEEYCMIYHMNSGYPLVDEGTRIVADFKSTEPRTEFAKEKIAAFDTVEAPVDNQDETCYFHKLNKPVISLINEKIGKKLTFRYSDDTLPCLIEWKSCASGDYVIGIEPCTSFLDGQLTKKTVGSGKTITNKIEIEANDL